MLPKLSLLDSATVGRDQPISEALADTVTPAQRADELGSFERLWFAEHHNMSRIASAATSVLIAHVAARTERIRVGSGGVMLPNHSPLVIAEQFGTLAELYPDRIDLGLGRAPGTDGATMRALRTDPRTAESFPRDVRELQGYLSGDTLIDGIHAYPGRGTRVPLYVLGSSLFGAQLAAAYGLPYAFASHFAPRRAAAGRAGLPRALHPERAAEQPVRHRRGQCRRRGRLRDRHRARRQGAACPGADARRPGRQRQPRRGHGHRPHGQRGRGPGPPHAHPHDRRRPGAGRVGAERLRRARRRGRADPHQPGTRSRRAGAHPRDPRRPRGSGELTSLRS
uniref:MsnO8 family LLM class oxidoreductase n=1 Tax=Janibacter limosus TaxID=53458 RepID=A0AC61U3P4_9MICO|nr:MsnO8 family LLM class oxidoreductase [Janibacter limosus]